MPVEKKPYINMVICEFGRFLGKRDESIEVIVNNGIRFKEIVEIVSMQNEHGQMQGGLMLIGDLTIPFGTPYIVFDIDNRSSMYADYFRATSGIALR